MQQFIKDLFSKTSQDEDVIKHISKKQFFTHCLAFIAILYFCFLWTYPLIDRDEGCHVGAAAEMLRNNEWVVPTLNGEHFLHKPVMLYWLTMPCLMVLGNNEMAARIPPAVSMFLLLICFFKLLMRITKNREFSVTSTLIMAFTPIFFIVARTALTDGPLLLFITGALLSFFIAMEEEKGPDRKWYMLFWLCFGLSFLTKGPVGPAVILPTLFFYCLFQKKIWHVIKRSNIPVGIIIFLLVNFWFFLIINELGKDYIDGFFGNQIMRRGTKVLVSRGGGPFYYILIFLLGGLPFSALFLPTFWTTFKMKYPERNEDSIKRLAYFAAIAATTTYVVFSCAATKLPHYVMPAFPWFSICTAYVIYKLNKGESFGKWVTHIVSALMVFLPALATLTVLVFPGAVAVILKYALKFMKPDSGEYALPMSIPIESYFVFPLALITLFLAIYPYRYFKQKTPYKAIYAMILGMILLCSVGILVGSIGVNILALPGKKMFVDVKNATGEKSKVVTYGLWKPSMTYYTERTITRYRFKYPDHYFNLEDEMRLKQPVYIMTRTRIKDKLEKLPGYVNIKQYGGYFLGGNKAAKKEFDAKADH